jgi:hypothetical protein
MSGRPTDKSPEEGAQTKGERRVFTLTLKLHPMPQLLHSAFIFW